MHNANKLPQIHNQIDIFLRPHKVCGFNSCGKYIVLFELESQQLYHPKLIRCRGGMPRQIPELNFSLVGKKD